MNRLLPQTALTALPNRALRLLASRKVMTLFQSPSDSFVLSRIVHEETGRCLRVVARSNWGVWSRRPARRRLQERVIHPFGSGMRAGLGYLPLDPTGRGGREFLHSVEAALGCGEPVLIFPGRSLPDTKPFFDQDSLLDGGIHPGAAHLARRYGLPILPAYIAGAESWRAGQAASVTFGPAFDCDGMSKEEICRQIIERIRTCRHLASAGFLS